MKHQTGILGGVLLLAGLTSLGFGQENYGSWTSYQTDTVNTTSTGASVSVTELNYPLLVRLNGGNFNFASSIGRGADLRFSKPNGTTHLPYQIEHWDSAGQDAEVWVLLDTVLGNSKGTTFRMYTGKSGASDSSSPAAVFSTANNYQGVFHLSEAAGVTDTIKDATGNHLVGIPRGQPPGAFPTDTVGVIGHAKNFLGSPVTTTGAAYEIQTLGGGAGSTSNDAGNPLGFKNDSSTVNGLPLYTMSAWVNVNQFPAGTSDRKAILAKSVGASGHQYYLRLRDPAVDQVDSTQDTNQIDFSDGVTVAYKSGAMNLVPHNWYHVVLVRSGPVGTVANEALYVNGGNVFYGSNSLTQTTQSPYDVFIGAFSNDSGFFNGKIDEVEFSNTARDTGWIKLSYNTQKTGSGVVTTSGSTANPSAPAGLSYHTNPVSLVTGTAMVPDTASVVSGTVTGYSVSPALPAGLSLNTTTGIISGTPTAAVAAATYTVTASNIAGGTSVGVSITVKAPPVIATSPGNVTVVLGGTAKLGVSVTGTAPFKYKWVQLPSDTLHVDSNISTLTDTLSLTSIPYVDSGSYECVVSNAVGTTTSGSAHIVVSAGISLLGPYMVHTNGGAGAFSFRIPQGSGITSVKMTVEDMTGRLVMSRVLEVGKSSAVSWHGDGTDGRSVPSGMYVVKMKLLTAESKAAGEVIETGGVTH